MEQEKLYQNIIGAELFSGKISPSPNHISEFFYIAENTDNKDYIEKEALQMLLYFGCSDFYFFGRQKHLWSRLFSEAKAKTDPTNEKCARIMVLDSIDDLVYELKERKQLKPFVPTDYYLIYDDKKLYEAVKNEICHVPDK